MVNLAVIFIAIFHYIYQSVFALRLIYVTLKRSFNLRNGLAHLDRFLTVRDKSTPFRLHAKQHCFCINDNTELLAGILSNGSKSSCDKSAQLDGTIKQSAPVTNGITEPNCTSDGSAPVMTKAHNLFYPNVTTCSNEKEEQDLTKPPNCSIYKTKEIKPKLINPINQSEDIDKRSDYSRIIRDNTECDFLIQQNPEKKETILELIDIIVDTVCSAKPTIRVNGEDIPHDIVKSTFLKLNSSHIEYVLEAMDNNISDVRNIRSYLITALYNSRLTLNSYWKSRVNHDMNKR